MTVGELRKALEGARDDLTVAFGDGLRTEIKNQTDVATLIPAFETFCVNPDKNLFATLRHNYRFGDPRLDRAACYSKVTGQKVEYGAPFNAFIIG